MITFKTGMGVVSITTRYKISPGLGIFLILLASVGISPVKCLKLTKGDDKVQFQDLDEGYYILTLDENIENVVLFYIEEASGDVEMMSSDCSDLTYGAQVNNTQVLLTRSLDYEKSSCQDTKNTLRDSKSGTSIIFQVKVNNLDDNPPQFQLGSHCNLNENTNYTIDNTTCSLTMTDLDGMMNGTSLTIEDDENSKIFGVSFHPEPTLEDTTARVVIFLNEGKTLDYETKYSYVFEVKAQETVQSGEVQIVIDVVDEPDTPPKFIKMFTTQQFEENVDQKFYVSAQDGDIGINSPISYAITKNGCQEYSCNITISEDGEINVKNVDREQTGNNIPLTVEAIEEDDKSSTPLDITFFIIDQDDNVPSIKMEEPEIAVDEGTRGNIMKFSVQDMDLSDNGTFSVQLDDSKSSVRYAKAFELIPDTGYQQADFIITVFNSTALDYEDKDWKVIKFDILVVEKANKTHTSSQPVTINLIDINDEPPIFVDESDSVDIPEDIGAGEKVFNATAVDRDEGDQVSYEIVGVWNKKLAISDQGIITTRISKVFDYELLQQVLISIKASDKGPTHTTTKTITINVQDVDDEPPVMRVDISTEDQMVKIDENSKSGTILSGVNIVVTDPDTKPKLKLEIDWQSSYVTKNSGIKTFEDKVWQCFQVDTSSEEKQTIERTISINDQCSPDFEKFDAVVLFFKATDENTVIGSNSTKGSILINIGDLNDNQPHFIDSSLKDLKVTDGTNKVTKIGIISAKDDDISDVLHFSIEPADENQPDWVDIDVKSGQLTIKDGVTIDCDVPKRDSISYYVTVHDPDPTHDNSTKVSIYIEDINDQYPHILWEQNEVKIYEKSQEDTEVSTLDSEDADRDDPFNTVVFKFETNLTNEASNRFCISDNGHISVKLRNGASLDRDTGPESYILPILAYDNPNGTLQLKDHFDLKVILLDLDDNVPTLSNKSLSCIENLKKDEILGDIVAFDPDEDGPNSDVSFNLKDVVAIGDSNKNKLDITFFKIIKNEAKQATIQILKPLRSFWGQFNLTILTNDAGKPDAYNENNITLSVEKFNFEQPVFTFPSTDDDKAVIVDKDLTTPKSTIYLYNGEKLRNLNVDDRQDHKWDVTYEIKDEDGGAADLFRVIPSYNSSWEGCLQIQRTLSDKELTMDHTVTINAKVKNDMKEGEASVSVETKMTITFFSDSKQPTFNIKSSAVKIEENSMDPTPIPENATFNVKNMKNIKPYYFITDSLDIFDIEPETGTITLKKPLDYEVQTEYTISIVALNKKIPPIGPVTDVGNILTVTVNVIDMNDNPPLFTPSKFTGAFLRTYNKGTTILTVNATDADPTLQNLQFGVGNFDCSESLMAPKQPFEIGIKDGKITNTFTVTSDMSGYCKFMVTVIDEPDERGTQHSNQTTVQINIISDNELVKFTFLNTDGFINENLDDISAIINEAFEDYNYESFLADLSYDDTWRNTTAHFYFLDKNKEPVPADEILGNLTDPNKYTTLTKTLATIHVQLYYFSYESVVQDMDDYLKIWLIVTIFVLGLLLVMTAIIFYFRNRALTRRINNLSTTKFGSQESGLNRAGVTAPTTNRNAIEGSNPVFNSESYIKEVEDDRNSVLSGDSDLLGVENNPDFD